jgi:serine protease Do
LIKELSPAVVSISIERHMLQKSSSGGPPPLFRTYPAWIEDRRRDRDRPQLDSIGSGFFADTAGHIVTNTHVVEGASKILATLSSGRVCSAKIVAVHPKVDLALIAIEYPQPTDAVKIGDSSKVQVGEWVMAMGNPFGLGRSVTLGIVSGKGRFIGLGPDDDFIQTDASINPGNSGGPLFNMAGEVIGVNTAVMASGRGIGFSIPSAYVRELIGGARMKQPGRGWLGIFVEDMTDEQAKLLGMGTPRGTYVDEAPPDTPGYKAGIRRGDLILDADGVQVRNGRHLSRIVSSTTPGDPVRLSIMRGKKTLTLDVSVGKAPD